MIVELIPPDASVLDLGCGSGGLLSRLAQRQQRRLMGIELEERAVVSCVQRGLDVVQHDVNQDCLLLPMRSSTSSYSHRPSRR
jgi:methionine biosynthesis protein MetW